MHACIHTYIHTIHSVYQWRYANPDPHPQRFLANIISDTIFLTIIFTKSLWAWVWVSVTPLSVVPNPGATPSLEIKCVA